FFATFPSTDEAGTAVSAIVAWAVVPAAIEMMDGLAMRAAVAATGVDWPDVGASLLMDVDGALAAVEHTSRPPAPPLRRAGARGGRPRDPDSEGRKRTGPHVEGPQERLRRRGPHQPELH